MRWLAWIIVLLAAALLLKRDLGEGKPAPPVLATSSPKPAVPPSPIAKKSRSLAEPLFTENPLNVLVTADPWKARQIFCVDMPLGMGAPPNGLIAAACFTRKPGVVLNFDKITYSIPEWDVKESDITEDDARVRHCWYEESPRRPGLSPAFLEVIGYRGKEAVLLYRELISADR